MIKLKCEDMMCDHCVSRINTALNEAQIDHCVDLPSKTVTVEGNSDCIARAKEILDDLGFTPKDAAFMG